MNSQYRFRIQGLDFLRIGIAISLLGTACAKQVQTLNYLDPQAPSMYMAKQEADDTEPVKSTGKEVKKDSNAYEAQGDQALSRGLIKEALEAYRAANALSPGRLTVHDKMGRIYLDQGQPALAISHFKQVVNADPHTARAFEGLGLAYLKMREDPKAEEAFTRALELDPDLADVYNGLGILQDRQGNHDLAVGFYQRALSMDPENPVYHNNLGYSLLLVKDLDDAIAALQEAVQRDPGFRKAHNNLGYAYGLKGEDARALEEFRVATDEAGAYNNLGYVYYQTGRYTKAAASFEKAIENSPVWYIKAAENHEFVSELMNGTTSDPTEEIP